MANSSSGELVGEETKLEEQRILYVKEEIAKNDSVYATLTKVSKFLQQLNELAKSDGITSVINILDQFPITTTANTCITLNEFKMWDQFAESKLSKQSLLPSNSIEDSQKQQQQELSQKSTTTMGSPTYIPSHTGKSKDNFF